MKNNKLFAIKKYITTCYNQEKDAYCWYNTSTILSQEEIEKLKIYFQEHNYNFMLIINGCIETRPQRTMGTFPTFLKGTNGSHIIYEGEHAFILCSWLEHYDDYEKDVNELMNDLPNDIECIVFRKSKGEM